MTTLQSPQAHDPISSRLVPGSAIANIAELLPKRAPSVSVKSSPAAIPANAAAASPSKPVTISTLDEAASKLARQSIGAAPHTSTESSALVGPTSAPAPTDSAAPATVLAPKPDMPPRLESSISASLKDRLRSAHVKMLDASESAQRVEQEATSSDETTPEHGDSNLTASNDPAVGAADRAPGEPASSLEINTQVTVPRLVVGGTPGYLPASTPSLRIGASTRNDNLFTAPREAVASDEPDPLMRGRKTSIPRPWRGKVNSHFPAPPLPAAQISDVDPAAVASLNPNKAPAAPQPAAPTEPKSFIHWPWERVKVASQAAPPPATTSAPPTAKTAAAATWISDERSSGAERTVRR
ncbi:MAG TPA: hypothetical protein VG713_06800 [Pirellulales bacterium]|nr:hypothetical protein [Pirellulales bacterium]